MMGRSIPHVKRRSPAAGMAHEHHHQHEQTAVDPVCEMTVDPASARSAEVRGKTYYFCLEGCRTKFVADPDRYLDRAPLALPPRKAEDAPEHTHHDLAHHQ